MVFDTNKEKGNSGLGMAIAYYSCNGYIVSVPHYFYGYRRWKNVFNSQRRNSQ